MPNQNTPQAPKPPTTTPASPSSRPTTLLSLTLDNATKKPAWAEYQRPRNRPRLSQVGAEDGLAVLNANDGDRFSGPGSVDSHSHPLTCFAQGARAGRMTWKFDGRGPGRAGQVCRSLAGIGLERPAVAKIGRKLAEDWRRLSRAERNCTSRAEGNCTTERRGVSIKVSS